MPTETSYGQLEPKFTAAYRAWKTNPGQQANADILQALEPVISGAVKHHVGDAGPSMRSTAKLMALDGLARYDPAKGKLQTHLYNHLQGLKRQNAKQLMGVRAPERLILARQHLNQEGEALEHELGREPTDLELADRTGFSLKRMAKVRSYQPGLAEGAWEEMHGPGGGVRLPGDRRTADLVRDMVLEDLDAYHQKVMELSLGMHGRQPLANHEIAARLKRSPGAISQAKARIQARLDEAMDLNPFG